jgi:hypothetical protein
VDVIVSEVVDVFFGHCFLLRYAVLKSELLLVGEVLHFCRGVMPLLNYFLKGFFDLIMMHLLQNLFLCALDLETTHCVQLIRLVLFPLVVVWVRNFLYMLMMHCLLFGEILLRPRGNVPCIWGVLELLGVGVIWRIVFDTCTVSHKFNLNTKRYILEYISRARLQLTAAPSISP